MTKFTCERVKGWQPMSWLHSEGCLSQKHCWHGNNIDSLKHRMLDANECVWPIFSNAPFQLHVITRFLQVQFSWGERLHSSCWSTWLLMKWHALKRRQALRHTGTLMGLSYHESVHKYLFFLSFSYFNLLCCFSSLYFTSILTNDVFFITSLKH